MTGLSKSKYTLFRQCGKALWLQTYKPEEAVIDDALKARFEAGNEVGDLAMGLFGAYEEVTTIVDDKLDLKTMIEKTQDCLARGVENIAEASFTYDGNYCAVDILHKTADGYAIYEVKSSSGNLEEDKKDKELVKYARDIAYQKYVLTKCGINVTGTYLVRLNNQYVLDGALDIQNLFYINNLQDLVAEEYPLVEANIADARAILAKESEPSCRLGGQCKAPYKCAFMDYCFKDIPSNSVFNIYRMSLKDKAKHYYNGIVSLEDAISNNIKLSPVQRIQVSGLVDNKEFINKNAISKFLDQLTYPLYFLDFETQQSAIPQYQGTRPYQQVPFQYSLHYIEYEGGPLLHKEFLAVSGQNPLRQIAEQLVNDIPMDVCTTAYYKVFECTRLRELAAMFPDLKKHLENIADHIVDLLDPFQSGYFYRPAMIDSFSIKKVLPALFPDDPALDYHNLEGSVHNGCEAMTIFPKIKDMSPADQIKARTALLKYCELDTFAMVKLWEKLKEVSQ